MKDTIKSLRNENRLLAQAMKMMSEGADLDTVIGTLPEVSVGRVWDEWGTIVGRGVGGVRRV
jgi:hypothetical protein